MVGIPLALVTFSGEIVHVHKTASRPGHLRWSENGARGRAGVRDQRENARNTSVKFR